MPLTSREDLETMLSRAGLGDRAAFEALYDATCAKLMAVCLRVLKDRGNAEDAMQDAYVKIWNNAGRYAVTGHSPMTWLITIARNTAIDRLRARKRTEPLDDHVGHIPSGSASPEQSAIAGSEARRIVACLDELEEARGAAIRGAYLDGQSYEDLAARFDVPINTMRTWLRRGLISLRECMAR